MTTKTRLLALAVVGIALAFGLARRSAGEPGLPELARQALSGEEKAVAGLRAAGPAGLAAFLAAGEHPTDPRWRQTLDSICRQRDCAASRLYWYTDLDAAVAAARSESKPILSLRLLGRLDDELSCANSRFFRTVLYANEEISALLSEQFILHWESVRPVPRLTVDMGDGRKLMGTITGNSIHYVLDQNGRLVDAIPGLYGPRAFTAALERAARVARQVGREPDPAYANAVRWFHRDRAQATEAELARRLEGSGDTARELVQAQAAPTAAQASVRAMAKSATEFPVLRQLYPTADRQQWAGAIDWEALAATGFEDFTLDAASRAELLRKHREAGGTGDNVVAAFERTLGIDTLRNELVLHATLHSWLGGQAGQTRRTLPTVDELNERVYAELFLTPSTDPWLGLSPADTFLALAPVGK
jgi:hypothetical protein